MLPFLARATVIPGMPCCFIEAFTTSSTAAPNVPAGSGLEAEEEELPPPQLANQTRLVNKKRREKHTGRTRFMFSPGGQVYTSCQCGVCDWLRPWAVAQREPHAKSPQLKCCGPFVFTLA